MAEKKYDLAQFKFSTKEILGTNFTVSDKITIEKSKPWNSKWSTAARTTEHELEWELEEVFPEYYAFFDKVTFEQDKGNYEPPTITTFDYDPQNGSPVPTTVFTGVYIEEISMEKSNQPFSVSGIALGKKDHNENKNLNDL